jgi:hypothetical protein
MAVRHCTGFNHVSRVDLLCDEPLTFRLRFLQYSHAEPASFLTLAGCHLATVGDGTAVETSVGWPGAIEAGKMLRLMVCWKMSDGST